jgi:ABC-type nickel/cobalt efflux system permease component RcnA
MIFVAFMTQSSICWDGVLRKRVCAFAAGIELIAVIATALLAVASRAAAMTRRPLKVFVVDAHEMFSLGLSQPLGGLRSTG